jgi:hypothetical protein
MKLKYLLIFFGVVFLMCSKVSGQKSDLTRISVIREDSIVNILVNFGKSADLFYDQYMDQRYPTDILSNDEGTRIFKNLFASTSDTCIFNFLDTARLAGTPFKRSLVKTDTVPDGKLRSLSFLSPNEYLKLHRMLYSGGGSTSEIDKNSINIISQSERKSFGKKYKIDVLAKFFFSGQNDSLLDRYVYDNQGLWFSFSFEKYKIKDEAILKNFKIIKIQHRPTRQPGDTTSLPPIEPLLLFSIEPYFQAGLTGGNHIFAETFDDYLSGKPGKSLDLGVNFSKPLKISENGKFIDLGLGLGYSLLSVPVTLKNYELVNKGMTPPFQPSSFFKEYNYSMNTDVVDENHILGFVDIPVFARLRFPVKENTEAFFKLGIHSMVPIHGSYRTDGVINYTGEFHYIVNNKETVISTDDDNANLESSIPNFNSLYGQKESLSWEKLGKSFGVSSKFETGFSFRTSEKIKYYVGAYISYRISGLKYGNDSGLIGQEGKINSFLTKTDKINPLSFGLTFSASFDVLKDSFKKIK